MIMSAFGLVTQNNSAAFVPFNQSVTPSVEQTTPTANGVGVQPVNATDDQQVAAYNQWITSS
jgi:mannan endo-1,4-beta-mannosidase